MTAIAARAEVDADRTLRIAVPCDLPPGPVDVVVQVATLDDDGSISPELAAEIAAMPSMSYDDLWRAAHSRLANADEERLADLNDERQRRREGLSAAEEAEAADLLRRYEWALFVRANALALLKGRGYDISGLLHP